MAVSCRRMKSIVMMGMFVEALPGSARAAEGGVAVPLATDWAAGLVILLVWMLVGALLVGPWLRKLKLGPRSNQTFADDLAEPRKY